MARYVLVLEIVMGLSLSGARADYYAAQNGQTPASPYTSWETAASNIQDAVNVATNATVWVGAGRYTIPPNGVVYNTITNVVYINRPLTLRSSNGAPASVIIDGAGTSRCVNIAYGVSTTNRFVLSGLTISNSYDKGILFYSPNNSILWTGVVENCLVVEGKNGAGIYDYQANASARTIIVSNSVISHNEGPGIYIYSVLGTGNPSSLIADCIVENNTSSGLSYQYGTNTLSRCIIRGNMSSASSGGLSMGAGTYYMYNCLVYNNTAAGIGGAIYKWSATGPLYIYNCTIVSNLSTAVGSGGVRSSAANPIVNSIVYSNYFNSSVDNIYGFGGTVLTNTCTSATNSFPGPGNITNHPQFVDFAGQNFRLAANSPCINAGLNAIWMDNALDMDSRFRKDRFSGVVDMGCYEYLQQGMVFNVY